MKYFQITIFVIVAILFLTLAVYSRSHVQTGYSQNDVTKLNQMCANANKPITLRQKQVNTLAEIYGITAEDAAKPIDLFRERGR
jgi:hypothetical protein